MVSIVRNELINLVTVTGKTRDKDGFETGEETLEHEIFAEVKSVGRTEYYDALRAGVKTSLIFEVHPEDYQMGCVVKDNEKYRPTKVIYDQTEYRIGRAYRKSMDSMELTCEEVE